MDPKKLNKALIQAAEEGQVEQVQLLLAQGAEPDGAKGFRGASVLSCAMFYMDEQRTSSVDVEARTEKIVGMLLAAGADPSTPAAIHALGSAAAMENPSILRMLLAAGASGLEQRISPDKKVLKKLQLDKEAPSGETISPLEIAIRRNRSAAVKCLLEHGINPNDRIPIPQTTRTQYPLWYAIEKKASYELVTILLDHGADPDVFDDQYRTAQWIAYIHERQDLPQLLCRQGKILQGTLGIVFCEPADAGKYLAPHGLESGVPVGLVAIDSAADRAGIQRGDVILRIEGKAVNLPSDFPKRAAFSVLDVEWWRNGSTFNQVIELGPAGPYAFRHPQA